MDGFLGKLFLDHDIPQSVIDDLRLLVLWPEAADKRRWSHESRTDQNRTNLISAGRREFLIKMLEKNEMEIETYQGKPEYKREFLDNNPLAQIAISQEVRQRYKKAYSEDLPIERPVGYFQDTSTNKNFMIYPYRQPIKVDAYTDFGEKVIQEFPKKLDLLRKRLEELGVTGFSESNIKIIGDTSTEKWDIELTNTEYWRVKGRYENKDETNIVKEIKSTPPDELILGVEKTEEEIARLRKIVSADSAFIERREKMLSDYQAEGGEIVIIDNVPHITLYRGIRPNFEVATTAAGFCKRTTRENSLMEKLQYLDDYEQKIDDVHLNENVGESLFKKIVGSHIFESDHSVLIPATMSQEYATSFNNRDGIGAVLKLTVPLSEVVPIYQYAEAYMDSSFAREREIGIAGRIEPEWVQIVGSDDGSKNLEPTEEISNNSVSSKTKAA